MTPSKIFFYFCLSFVGGIFLSSTIFTSKLGFSPSSKAYLLPGLILGIILISVFWKYKKFVVAGFCILFIVTGIWRHQLAESRITNNELIKFNDLEEKITLIGIVSNEPDIKEKSIRLAIEVKEILTENGSLLIGGKVLVTVQRYPEYRYGDKVRITGKLKTPPEDINGFNYKDYLKKDGIYSVMDFPKIETVGQGFGSPVMAELFSFKNKFQDTARKFFSPPQEGILEALIFGEESQISQDLKEKLNLTGTRHIAAVSGMNITILAFLILNFLLFLGFWRKHAFYLSVALLVLYILMIGAPASAVRAGVMGGLLMTAQYFGRMSQAARAVTFAAFFMLILNPLLLRFDVGFQLSFLAILGLIYLQPTFSEKLKVIPNPKFFPIKTTLSATLSAQIFTTPILIYNFGYVSAVSPITNVLIVPFLAPITILIFLFGLSAMIFEFLGFIFSFPVWFSLTYIVNIIELFSRMPFVSLTIKNVHWAWLVFSYLVLIFVVRRLEERRKLNFLNY